MCVQCGSATQLQCNMNGPLPRSKLKYAWKVNLFFMISNSRAKASLIYMRDPRPPIPPRVMAFSATGLNLGVFGFVPATHARKTQHVHDRCAPCGVLHVFYLHAQTAVDLHTWGTAVILIMRKKPGDPQFEPHAGMKMAQVLVSLVYICSKRLCFDFLILNIFVFKSD